MLQKYRGETVNFDSRKVRKFKGFEFPRPDIMKWEVILVIFKRKIYSKFLTWKNETGGKKALLIEGARRIGKSTIVEEFARNEYKSYILIDFARVSEDVKNYFHKLQILYIF